MRLRPVLFALLLSLGVLAAQSATAQVIINARIGRPYYGPQGGYYGYGPGYYPPVAPVVIAPPYPVVGYPQPYYYAPRAYYGPRPYYGRGGYGRGYGRRY